MRIGGWIGAVAVCLAAGLAGAETRTPVPDERFATVNGQPVSYADFYTALQDQVGADVAERMLLEMMIRQEATRLKLAPSDAEIDDRIRQLINERFAGNGDAFAAWMLQSGNDEDSLRRRVAVELMDLRLRTQGLDVSDGKLQEYFKANQAKQYDLPQTVRFRQVVLNDKPKADQVLGQIKSGEVSFFSAAARFSVDPQAVETGGLVGPQPVPVLAEAAKPIHDALAQLQPNDVAPQPVELNGHWYLLLLIERQAGRPVTYDEVRDRVRMDYLNDKAAPEEQFYQELMKKTVVKGLPARYRAIEGHFGPPATPTAPTTPGPKPMAPVVPEPRPGSAGPAPAPAPR